jgi:transglutaminase-like putative cysteine protease
MRRSYLWCGVALLLASPTDADTPKPKRIHDIWEASYLEGAKLGHTHTAIEEVERDGKKVFITTGEMRMTIKRYDAVTEQRFESGSDEGADGKVTSLTFSMLFGKEKRTLSARVDGDKVTVTGPDGKEFTLPWDAKVIGPARQERLFADKKVKGGDKFDYRTFELALGAPITMRAVVKDVEEVDLLEPKKVGDMLKVDRVKKKLLRVEVTPDKVEIDGRPIPLPRQVYWLNKDREVVRSETDMPGLGKITSYRTTKDVALQKGVAPELLPDLGLNNFVKLNKALKNPLSSRSAVYRITLPGESDAGTAFATDNRQTVKNAKGEGFELHVRSQRDAAEVDPPAKIKDEFRKSCFFIDSDDEKVKELATTIIGKETDAWAKARRIEKWVHDNMTGDSSTDFMPASQIARERKGDCRQHGILTAALCRAAGVPSRTAIGLIYADLPGRGPCLAFHLWTEVFVKGQWLGLDATLGKGGVGIGHLKITDSSWAGIQTLAPTLPVIRVIGRAKVEILKEE